MKKNAGGLVELLLAFLILSVVVAFAMKTTLMQMKSPDRKGGSSVTNVSSEKVDTHVPTNQIEEVLDIVEEAKRLKHEQEQQVIDSWTR